MAWLRPRCACRSKPTGTSLPPFSAAFEQPPRSFVPAQKGSGRAWAAMCCWTSLEDACWCWQRSAATAADAGMMHGGGWCQHRALLQTAAAPWGGALPPVPLLVRCFMSRQCRTAISSSLVARSESCSLYSLHCLMQGSCCAWHEPLPTCTGAALQEQAEGSGLCRLP